MGFCIGLAFLYLVSVFLIAFPEKIVSAYAGTFKTNDEKLLAQMDRLQVFNPMSKFLVGKMSDFATQGSEHPENFPHMIWFIRSMGLISTIVYTLMLLYAYLKR